MTANRTTSYRLTLADSILIPTQHCLQTIRRIVFIESAIIAISKDCWCTIISTHDNKHIIGIKHIDCGIITIGNSGNGTSELNV